VSVEETLATFGLGEDDLAAWRVAGRPAEAWEDWLTDRVARRPQGVRARRIYGADDVHEFARRATLDALGLSREDHLLEIGCGGGLLLREALRRGAATTGVDHSEEMVRLARERALALYASSPELRGTPAAPEPLASRLHFYDDEALASLARASGFTDVLVKREDGDQLLTARKPGPTVR
jgi:SAM-dependent methyltransferase